MSPIKKPARPEGGQNRSPLEDRRIRLALAALLEKLDKSRLKEVFLLHRMKGLKQQEIAEKLDISVKTIKNQIWASLQRLRKCLEQKEAWRFH